MTLEALTCPGLADSRETLVERVGMWIPVLGWCAASFAWDARVRPFVNEIKNQLKQRHEFPVSAWGHLERRLSLARWLSRTVKEEIGWPNDHFHPEDPVRLAFWAYKDGLDIDFLLMAIEDRIGAKITDADCQRLETMTLGQAVDFFLATSKSSGG